jgi:aryl-alcohol dehydrogenase-like predicted oxidoreductase
MSAEYAPTEIDDERSGQVLARAVELGARFFDTADVYGPFTNERLVGRALSGADVVIATKAGLVIDEAGSESRPCGNPAHLRAACDASLARLGVDAIDLYYLHRVDPTVPIEDTVGAMATMVEQGKVRHLGLSEASADTLRRAAEVHPISALQTEWSIFSRDIEDTVLPAARELGIGIVAYSPLGRGLLTGSVAAHELSDGDFRHTLPRWQADNLGINLTLVARIRDIAARAGATPGQVALAWLLARGPDVVPIPGTKRRVYLRENLASAQLTLSAPQLSELSALRAAGDRYPDMTWVTG